MSSSEGLDAMPTAGKPRWLTSTLYAAAATAAVCWPAWPGLMSSDSLFAYKEARTGIQTMTWPPMHAYLFFLSRAVGADTWGLFLLQTFLIFFSAAVIINLLTRSTRWAFAGLALFALSFLYAPELLGTALVHWHDVPTTSFALAGIAAWLIAARQRSTPLLVLAAASLGIAAALRYNSILLLIGVAPLMVWAPFLSPEAPRRVRGIVAVALAASLGLAWASTHWRLPDLRGIPAANSFGGTEEFDLIGISACSDKTYLPPDITGGWPISPKEIRQAYDPRHLQIAFRAIPGSPRLTETDAEGAVEKIWPLAVRDEFGCYLAHRTAVFVQQMGMARDGVFYPTEGGIIANPYGLEVAHPSALAKIVTFIRTGAPQLWRRPFLLYLLAAIAVAALWARRSRPRLLMLAALAGAFAYAGVLFVAAPAADARYIFPSSVFCAFVAAAAAAIVMDERRTRALADLAQVYADYAHAQDEARNASAAAQASARSSTTKSRSRRRGTPIVRSS